MTKSLNNNPLIQTPKGIGELERIYISELGFLMLRIYNLDGTYTTYNLGKHDTDNNIFSNQIIKNEYEKSF